MARDVDAENGLAGLGQAFAMIVTSEIGDKTFFIVCAFQPLHFARIYV